ncbi:probable E3 SUMO-protein ligase RNF212 isoform X2 [Pararge aegeria]|uniref:probable E3 SUMO-protein ligase RNF212 isoform X2 n=1 Tax=Pararge aegeria TaxID=116150 RepID=UPI0019D20F58|nr:probable E3 SUMO-protein ligase RNF212 isoform X2 [Pararge aegeria]
MDWIHCNNCYTQLEPGITLYLTSCGHMFCNNCLDNGVQEGTCLVCKVPCSVMKLAPDMNHEIQDYFTDPDDILQKCCEVLQFQRRHRRRLLSYLVQSTKKFYGARTELKRMTELCQKQHKQLREYQKIIKSLESQLSAQPRQTSPFNVPISPGNNVSPNFLQTTPNYKRARSTPYSSNLVTPTRIIKNRTGNMSAQSQKSNNSNKISSTVFTPPTPESAGLFSSQSTTESGYSTSGSWKRSPSIVYCNGYAEKCAFKRLKR